MAKPATASSLNLWGRVHFWRNLKLSEIMIFCEFCKFANFWTGTVRLKNIMLKICSNLGWGYLQLVEKRVKSCADHPANIHWPSRGKVLIKMCATLSNPTGAPCFREPTGKLGSRKCKYPDNNYIHPPNLLSCMRSNDTIRDLPRILLVYALRQAMPYEASQMGYMFSSLTKTANIATEMLLSLSLHYLLPHIWLPAH